MAATPTLTPARDPHAPASPAGGVGAAAAQTANPPGVSIPPSGSVTQHAAMAAPPAAARLREDLIHPDPLLDCLVEVCRLHGVGASRASLSAGLPLVNGRLTLELAERAAARAGMSARLQRLPLAELDAASLPALLILHGNKACVLQSCSADSARVLLPETGQGSITMPLDELAKRYTGVVLFVRPHFRFDQRAPLQRATRRGHWFWSVVLAQRFVYRDVMLAALLVNLFALAFPLFSMNVYDRVVPNNAVETLWALAIGVTLILLADFGLRKLRSRFVDEASARIDVELSARLMERVLGMRLENKPESVGSFASNLRGFEQVRDFIASSTVTTLIDLPFAALFVVVTLWISPWLAIPPVVVFTIIVITGYIAQHRLHELAETTYRASAQRNATLVESLAGIETIKTQGAEGVIQARWERVNTFLARINVRMRGLSSGAMYAANTLTQFATVAVILIGVYLIGDRQLTMGGLIAASMLAGRALAPAGQIVGLLMQYQGARTALESLDRLMAKPVERPSPEEGGQPFVQRREFKGEIEFRNVRFHYPARDDMALDGVSFRIAPGERVALIGRVGSGKSTIQRLMMGLYEPTDGAVMLDGIDLRQLDPADVRRGVGCVSQDVLLFYGSLRENITLGLPYADDSTVLAAAETAGLSDFVNRHPRGFDMPVGERGDSLSGGQRQCVGLARALLHNAPVLLLDEPTSAMDFSTEAQITQRITAWAQLKTVVLVTHRTSLLSLVSRVIVIDGGKVVADGPRDRIMEALQTGRIAKAA
jgi:ATP-binding cassette subfamily C protein LapB